MKEKIKNLIIFILLGILMIVAITIVLVNPNKAEKRAIINNLNENILNNNLEIDSEDSIEERKLSMQSGKLFCKVEDLVVFYEENSKSIYSYNVKNLEISKIIELENEIEKMYFDGQNIYYLPYYYGVEKGIYRVDLQGNRSKISDLNSLQLYLTDNEIYFVNQIGFDDMNQNPQGTICKMDKDGTNITQIADSIKNYFYINNDKIYYTSQDRKMYEMKIDGTDRREITQGRKFLIDVSDKYVLYIDYGTQETEHIFNLETGEDNVICNYGQVYSFEGITYINGRKRLEDGGLDEEYTLFKIRKNGSILEIGKIANFSTTIKYILNEKIYLSNQDEGMYVINLNNNQKEKIEQYEKCRYFIGKHGYIIDTSDLENIKIQVVEL